MHGHLKIRTHIFLTGATGYIGGSVLTRLLSHPLSDTFRTTVLVRSPEKAPQFRAMGIRAIVGSNSDLELLKEVASDSDLVIACADADDLDAAKAILQGLKDRYEKTGNVPSLIHTSGTGVLVDDARGMCATDSIYSDLNIGQLATLPPTQPHREVDLTIIDADKQGYIKSYIILPSTIYGQAVGPLVDAGLQHPRSQQIPKLVELSLDRGHTGMVGEGKNIWPNVHISEVADLYILLISPILPHDIDSSHKHTHGHKAAFGHGEEGYYFSENGEHELRSVSEEIGRIMVDLGKATTASPTPLTAQEIEKYFKGNTMMGSNSRCRADRSRAIGWKPKKGTKDMLASIRAEIIEDDIDDLSSPVTE